VKLTIKDCTQRVVLLKLTTDRHEASHGLFATAELLVLVIFPILLIKSEKQITALRYLLQAVTH